MNLQEQFALIRLDEIVDAHCTAVLETQYGVVEVSLNGKFFVAILKAENSEYNALTGSRSIEHKVSDRKAASAAFLKLKRSVNRSLSTLRYQAVHYTF